LSSFTERLVANGGMRCRLCQELEQRLARLITSGNPRAAYWLCLKQEHMAAMHGMYI
jgi:hypothetical protein